MNAKYAVVYTCLLIALTLLQGCANRTLRTPSGSLREMQSGYMLLPMPNNLTKVGQLVDDSFTPIQSEPSRYWDSDVGNGIEKLTVSIVDAARLRGVLNLLGVDPARLTEKNLMIAAGWIRDEAVTLEFVDAKTTELAIHQVNQYPRSYFIRRDYSQLADAFDEKSGVRLIAGTISASEFRMHSLLSAETESRLNELFDLKVDWSGNKIYRVKGGQSSGLVVAARFPSSKFKLKATFTPAVDLKYTNHTLHSLLGTSRVNIPIYNHGIANFGPYAGVAQAEILETRSLGKRVLKLKLHGEIKNPGAYSSCAGGKEIVLIEVPAHWVIEIDPVSACQFESRMGTGDYRGLRIHGDGTSSSLVSTVEISCEGSFFVFHNVNIRIYTD